MRQRISLCAGLLAAVLLCGCGESKEAKEARLSGIERMAEGDYGGAIASFEEALEASDGIVERFELDILKYRGEAEYLARDYAAAAYTYGTLEQVEGERAEYRYYKAAAEAMAGNFETAQTDYEAAAGLSKVSDQSAQAAASAALTALSEAARQAGETEKALEYCRTAIDGGMAGPGILNQMGLGLAQAGNLDEAVSYFEQGLLQAEGEAAAVLTRNLAAVYEQKLDFAKALELLREYRASWGSVPEVDREIAFLESR